MNAVCEHSVDFDKWCLGLVYFWVFFIEKLWHWSRFYLLPRNLCTFTINNVPNFSYWVHPVMLNTQQLLNDSESWIWIVSARLVEAENLDWRFFRLAEAENLDWRLFWRDISPNSLAEIGYRMKCGSEFCSLS